MKVISFSESIPILPYYTTISKIILVSDYNRVLLFVVISLKNEKLNGLKSKIKN